MIPRYKKLHDMIQGKSLPEEKDFVLFLPWQQQENHPATRNKTKKDPVVWLKCLGRQ